MKCNELLFVFILFCTTTRVYSQSESGFILNGNIQGLKAETTLYLTKNGGEDTVGKTISKDGHFKFIGKEPLGADFYYIKLDTLISTKPSKALLLLNAPIELNTSLNEWPKLELVGSTPHDEYIEVLKMFAVWNKELNGYAEGWSKTHSALSIATNNADSMALEDKIKELEAKRDLLEKERKSALKKYIESHRNSLYIAHLISKMEGMFDITEMKELYSKLSVDAKAGALGIALNNRLKIGEVKKGNIVGDFNKPSLNGTDLSLREVLAKSKFTLLDFWASWCKPCRDETPNVRKAYELYHDKGFNVLSVTLDTNQDAWRKAIAKDTMPWYHMIDTKSNSIAQAYRVTAIPATFLLDEDGKIIAMGLRGEELINKLKQLMSE